MGDAAFTPYLTTDADLVPDGADWAVGWIETDRD